MLPLAIRKLGASLQEEGVLASAQKTWRYFLDYVVFVKRRRQQLVEIEHTDAFDSAYGTDTSSLVLTEDLGVSREATEHATLYWPSRRKTVERVLESLNIDHSRFTLIDLGSGKGRVLLMASFQPYRRIVGVEFSEKLHRIALQNARVFNPPERKCKKIDLVHQDAAAFEFPDGNLVVYLFDSFDRTVLEPVMANLAASIRSNPREVWFVYLHARLRDVIEQSGLFELLVDSPRVGPKHAPVEYDYCIYRHRPQGSPRMQ